MAQGKTLEELDIVNTFVSELPGDKDHSNVTRQVHGALWSPVSPTPADGEPSLIAYSVPACSELGLDPTECERPEFPLLMAGAAPLPKGKPFAQVCPSALCCSGPHLRLIRAAPVSVLHTGTRCSPRRKQSGPSLQLRHAPAMPGALLPAAGLRQ